MPGKRGSPPPALSSSFESVQPEAAVTMPCMASSQVAAKGNIFVIENNRIPPTDTDKIFGHDAAFIERLPEKPRERLKEDFIKEQLSQYREAQAKTLLTYENHLTMVRANPIVELKGVVDASLETEIDMLNDIVRPKTIEAAIKSGKSAAVAIDEAYEAEIQEFSAMRSADEAYFKKAIQEVMQHRATIQHHLHPDKTVATYDQVPKNSIVFTDEGISLADVVGLIDTITGKPKVAAILTTKGSLNSHAAIIARNLGIPYFRVDEEQAKHFKNNEECIIDGSKGYLLIQPSRTTADAYEARIEEQRLLKAALDRKWHAKRTVTTLDGKEIKVHANVGISPEAPSVRAANPTEIGLYRSEMAQAMNGTETITPEKWQEITRHIMQGCAFKDGGYMTITFRTLDTAGDKGNGRTAEEQKEYEEPIIAAQMLGLLRLNKELEDAGHKRKIKIMVPMIGSIEELAAMQCKFNSIAEEYGLPTIKLGTMIEVPSILDQLNHLDAAFFSVGSNDMIASLLGIDRYNAESMKKYDPTNVTVLNALEKVTTAAEARAIPASICGDIASQPKYMALLMGAGFHNLSSGVDSISANKEFLSRIDTHEAKLLFEELKTVRDRADRETLLTAFNEKLGLRPHGTLDMNWQKPEGPAPALVAR